MSRFQTISAVGPQEAGQAESMSRLAFEDKSLESGQNLAREMDAQQTQRQREQLRTQTGEAALDRTAAAAGQERGIQADAAMQDDARAFAAEQNKDRMRMDMAMLDFETAKDAKNKAFMVQMQKAFAEGKYAEANAVYEKQKGLQNATLALQLAMKSVEDSYTGINSGTDMAMEQFGQMSKTALKAKNAAAEAGTLATREAVTDLVNAMGDKGFLKSIGSTIQEIMAELGITMAGLSKDMTPEEEDEMLRGMVANFDSTGVGFGNLPGAVAKGWGTLGKSDVVARKLAPGELARSIGAAAGPLLGSVPGIAPETVPMLGQELGKLVAGLAVKGPPTAEAKGAYDALVGANVPVDVILGLVESISNGAVGQAEMMGETDDRWAGMARRRLTEMGRMKANLISLDKSIMNKALSTIDPEGLKNVSAVLKTAIENGTNPRTALANFRASLPPGLMGPQADVTFQAMEEMMADLERGLAEQRRALVARSGAESEVGFAQETGGFAPMNQYLGNVISSLLDDEEEARSAFLNRLATSGAYLEPMEDLMEDSE